MQITLRNVQYHPASEPVALLLEHDFGALFVNTTQSALQGLAPAGALWGDSEALAAAQQGIAALFPGRGYTVVLP